MTQPNIAIVCYIVALVLLILSAFNVSSPHLNLLALGLFFFVLGVLLGGVDLIG